MIRASSNEGLHYFLFSLDISRMFVRACVHNARDRCLRCLGVSFEICNVDGNESVRQERPAHPQRGPLYLSPDRRASPTQAGRDTPPRASRRLDSSAASRPPVPAATGRFVSRPRLAVSRSFVLASANALRGSPAGDADQPRAAGYLEPFTWLSGASSPGTRQWPTSGCDPCAPGSIFYPRAYVRGDNRHVVLDQTLLGEVARTKKVSPDPRTGSAGPQAFRDRLHEIYGQGSTGRDLRTDTHNRSARSQHGLRPSSSPSLSPSPALLGPSDFVVPTRNWWRRWPRCTTGGACTGPLLRSLPESPWRCPENMVKIALAAAPAIRGVAVSAERAAGAQASRWTSPRSRVAPRRPRQLR